MEVEVEQGCRTHLWLERRRIEDFQQHRGMCENDVFYLRLGGGEGEGGDGMEF